VVAFIATLVAMSFVMAAWMLASRDLPRSSLAMASFHSARAAVISDTISAIRNCRPWCSMIGLPNCVRSLA
jgi:hypothetical protein